MGASITLAGESLIAQKQGAQQVLTVARFVLANVPGLDPNSPVDRAAGKPAAGQIVGTYDVTQAGYVNPNQVVYSLMMGSDIGDFDWNWIGLETADNVLLAVAYVAIQQKRRNIPPLQLGNNVTRNFLVAFDGAQALTGITIDASTWQHDFTVRLAGIDERERLSNREMFGRACFFGSALQVEKVGESYQLKPGVAYLEGIRLELGAALPIIPTAIPSPVWIHVSLSRVLSDVVASWKVVFDPNQVDYTDGNGTWHYCIQLASLPDSNTVTDVRTIEPINEPLIAHLAARVGDYAGLRARATTKDDVGLGNLPNAKSDDENTDSSQILATTKAVKAASTVIWNAIANIVSGATVVGKAAKLAISRTINGVPFDGAADITVADGTKLPLTGGTMTGITNYSSATENQFVTHNWHKASVLRSAMGNEANGDWIAWVYTPLGQYAASLRFSANGVLSAPVFNGDGSQLYNLTPATPTVPGITRRNTASIGPNGWWKCAETGLIKQWGVAQGAAHGTDYRNFPIAFPNSCLSLVATRTSLFTDDTTSGTNSLIVDNARFAVISGPFSSPDTIYWEATGY